MKNFSFKAYWRGFLLVGLSAGGCALFFHELTIYLSGLQKPFPLELAFSGSLMLALIMELRHGINRLVFVQATVTIIIFVTAVYLAEHLRFFYMVTVNALKAEPLAKEVIGEEYYSVITNAAVGYGGCFAISITLVRLCLWGILRKILLRVLTEEGQSKICPCCGSVMKTF
ncbi:hypothetical protein ACLI07_23585 (plasmid) [Providencia huaxiensis]|uniref:Uncharacterized protein n=6 Tax=Enterobacterales TaxID=91347 RepID=A0A7L8KAT1_ECOLX|nr:MULTISPECIES: hypothetical protein [Enterobacterales]ELY4881611.1 hypothetical protein [Morganella morganii]SPY66719.1 Uncharacterised protein [Providencia stuartii]ELB1214780.1 hypothetical protein [Proteus mirabilis]ELR5094222.1 hypothetical protein [Providencia rettgeri]ELR5243256.1 hypothetical protein [Providencia rettgeri]